MGLTKSELVGTYRLLYGGIERSDWTIEYPYGEDAIGYLVYLDNDHVSWHIMAADRPPFFNPDLLGGSPEENDGAFRTSNGYFGKYTIEGDVVRYDIEVAQVPNMVGPGHSHARLEGDELSLTSKRMQIGGQEGHTKFVWKRVDS
ncbi:MAG: lipocalin-like domain-containing protein [Actinomycetota bacterium]|nr:lipocalin-like domain-containing protein [Actinomycetota bacterium]